MPMSGVRHRQIIEEIAASADAAVRAIVTAPQDAGSASAAIERMAGLQRLYGREFPVLGDEVELWETLWDCTDRVRDQWDRVEKAAARIGGGRQGELQTVLDRQRRGLYEWMRGFVAEHAPRVPETAHFELGIQTRRSDCRGLHERMEGLYESIKRIGRLPEIRTAVDLPPDRVNFGIIYGGGWNVSAFSVLREPWHFGGMNAFVAFDHPGCDLYGRVGGRVVRLATAGLFRTGEADDYVLAALRRPAVLHFVCPHQWTGPPPHELGIPVLRSELTLEIVDDKLNTTRALRFYARRTGADLPLPREVCIEQAPVPAEADQLAGKAKDAIRRLEAEGVGEVVVKPRVGERELGVGFFRLPAERSSAVQHAVRLALDSGAVIQERIRPPGEADFNWRVLVALSPRGEPLVVGRFARKGHGDNMVMVGDRDMLTRCGIAGAEADALLARLDAVSLDAFRAVAEYARVQHPRFPWHPLGGGSYHVPNILGVDLIGDAYIMEVNGHEVAGMWTDDRLYPETRGRSNRTVLQSAEVAGRAYKGVLEAGR